MELNRYIDHTLLKPEAVSADYQKLCREAMEWKFFSVCVPPTWVSYCRELLANSEVLVATVIGFPLGYQSLRCKVAEATEVLAGGANELDMVINVSFLKDGRSEVVAAEIAALKRLAGSKVLKVIIETSLLNESEKRLACQIVDQSGADFVKTSTGFSGGGATVEDLRLMKASISSRVAIKASGGIRDLVSARQMIEAGATRLGTSSGVALMRGLSVAGDY